MTVNTTTSAKAAQMSYVDEYFSACTNRSSHAVDIDNSTLLYASSNSIIIYDHKKYRVVNKLDGHSDHVTSVKWITPGISFVSTSSDRQAIIWELSDVDDKNNFRIKHQLAGHQDLILVAASIVKVADTLPKQDSIKSSCTQYVTCSSSNDLKIGIWRDQHNVQFVQNKFFVFDLKIVQNKHFLSQQNLLLLLGGSDANVHLWQLDSQLNVKPILRLEGHSEWIRSVDFTLALNDTRMFIASGCQDNFIRIWKIEQTTDTKQDQQIAKVFSIGELRYASIVDTVIAGHEDKIYCVRWVRSDGNSGNLRLLSTSTDRTAIIWEQSASLTESDGLWLERYRFGEISGNNLGFLSGNISPDGKNLVVNSYNGALHLWKFAADKWKKEVVISGHFAPVSDICWNHDGSYFLSCSLDQTTRLHSRWAQTGTWHEIARPQVHGYELNCIACISPLKFASGADEKVLRLFQATNCFVQSYKAITNNDYRSLCNGDKLPEFATVPNLGLSNIAVFEKLHESESKVSAPIAFSVPPPEENLLLNSFWSEYHKLYGHGYELFAVDANKEGTLLASACKATNEQDASICIWDLFSNFKQAARLAYHRLTITRLRFSPNGKLLVSVSRDRNWALFSVNIANNHEPVKFQSGSNKSTCIHSRVIWDVCWTPDSTHFLTVSRDKLAIFWTVQTMETLADDGKEQQHKLQATASKFIYQADESILSCSISTSLQKQADDTGDNSAYFVALGLENGNLLLASWSSISGWTIIKQIHKHHTLSIKRLAFNPSTGHQLASAGSDGFVRLLTFDFSSLPYYCL